MANSESICGSPTYLVIFPFTVYKGLPVLREAAAKVRLIALNIYGLMIIASSKGMVVVHFLSIFPTVSAIAIFSAPHPIFTLLGLGVLVALALSPPVLVPVSATTYPDRLYVSSLSGPTYTLGSSNITGG